MAAADNALGIEVSDEDLATSDSPELTGRAIAYLAADPKIKARSGKSFPWLPWRMSMVLMISTAPAHPMDEFTQDWSSRLKQLRAITTR